MKRLVGSDHLVQIELKQAAVSSVHGAENPGLWNEGGGWAAQVATLESELLFQLQRGNVNSRDREAQIKEREVWKERRREGERDSYRIYENRNFILFVFVIFSFYIIYIYTHIMYVIIM